MRIWYDCEFLENGRTIDPISIGMVREDGVELYLINKKIEREPLYDRICKHTWLMANVVPHLPLSVGHDGKPRIGQPGHENVLPRKSGYFDLDGNDNRIVGRRYLRNAVRDFVLAGAELPADYDGPPVAELWGWYSAYDHVLLCQLFGPMMALPRGFPMWTNDIQQEYQRQLRTGDYVGALPPQPDGQHNALEDARWNMRAWKNLDLTPEGR